MAPAADLLRGTVARASSWHCDRLSRKGHQLSTYQRERPTLLRLTLRIATKVTFKPGGNWRVWPATGACLHGPAMTLVA
jgi:hypothetical protein